VPDVKITAMPAATAITGDDLLTVVDSPASAATSKKITAANARKFFDPEFNVADYGAVGDGTTNDTAACQAAADAAETAGGGKILIPTGFRCRLNSTLNIPPGVGIVGTGNGRQNGGSGFFAGATGGRIEYEASAIKGVSSRDFYFDGNGVATVGIKTNVTDSMTLSNVRIESVDGVGLWVYDTQNSIFQKISVESCDRGYVLDGGVGGCSFYTCNAFTCSIRELHFAADTAPGVGAYTHPFNNSFYDCIFENTSSPPAGTEVLLSTISEETRFFGCVFAGPAAGTGYDLVDMVVAYQMRFMGCYFHGSSSTTGPVGIRTINGSSLYLGGNNTFINLSVGIHTPTGSFVPIEQVYLNNVGTWNTGNTNIPLQTNFRSRMRVDRPTTTDLAIAAGLESESAPRWWTDGAGIHHWGAGGSDFTGDVTLFRSAAGRVDVGGGLGMYGYMDMT
jgi:hypothetical protein